MGDGAAEDLRSVFANELATLGDGRPELRVVETPSASPVLAPLRDRLADRCAVGSAPTYVTELLGLAVAHGHVGFAVGPAEHVVPPLYPWARAPPTQGGGTFRLVATRSGLTGALAEGVPPVLDDLATMAGLPVMTVLVPCDGPSTRAATQWLASARTPAYLRLSEEPKVPVSPAPFEVGRARELRPGTDLAVLALGNLVAEALEVAADLHRVGLEARVLDLGSVKPLDARTILRAARDTGALLTLEEHSVTNGVGTRVASLTAENYPVPVRRLGIPDLPGTAGTGDEARERWGLSRTRIVDEAWELLRAKGKVQ